MTEARIELLYRVRKWPMVFALLLVALGITGGVAGGVYLYRGGDFGVQQGLGALLRGKSGAAILWCFAGVGAVAEVLVIASWRAIARRQPRVVLEADAITVPSKWRMTPLRIPFARVTGVTWFKKQFGKVGYIWVHHDGGKAVIVEDLLEKADGQLIVDWIESRQAGIDRGSN